MRDGRIPADYLGAQVKAIDKTTGDIDTISKRLAFIRTWTYVAQRENWTEDSRYWREETRRVEDRLSDALHGALTDRFVDRRTSVLLRGLKQRESLVAEVSKDGEVSVDGQFIGRLEGFRFRLDPKASAEEAKTLRAAGIAALAPQFILAADRMYNAPDSEFDLTEQGGLMWGTDAVGKLVKGGDVLAPQIDVFVDDEAGADVAEKVRRRLSHWLERRIAALFEPLLALKADETLTGLSKGVGFQLVEALGVVERQTIADDIKALDQDSRGQLRKHGVRFGQYTIFQHAVLKPAPTRLRLVLKGLFDEAGEFPEAPPPGVVTVEANAEAQPGYYTQAGYRVAGKRAIRIDMLERLADLIRAEDARGGFEATGDMLSLTGLSHEQFADLMSGLGYVTETGERPKVRVKPDVKLEDAPGEAAPAQPEAEVTEKEEASPTDAEQAETAKPEPDAAKVDEAKPDSAATSDDEPEIETFYTFTWKGRPRADRANTGKQNKGPRKPKGGRKPQKQGENQGKAKKFEARPAKKKEIDPDSPFAALAALKGKG